MTRSFHVFRACAGFAALLLAACANPVNGPLDNLPVEARFPITVEPHMEALRVAVDPARGGLSPQGNADLERFARDYLDNGSGVISISGSRRTPAAPGVVAERLAALGVPRERIMLANPDALDAGDEVRVSYIRYQAHVEPCGDWSANLGYTASNRPSANFGCATQHNLAAMVADPRDLLGPGGMGPVDTARRAAVMDHYEKGEITQADKRTNDKAIEQSAGASTVGQ